MDRGVTDVVRRRCGVEDVAGERCRYRGAPVSADAGAVASGPLGCRVRDVCGGDGGLERWTNGYQPRAVYFLRQECEYHARGELCELQLWGQEWECGKYCVWWWR